MSLELPGVLSSKFTGTSSEAFLSEDENPAFNEDDDRRQRVMEVIKNTFGAQQWKEAFGIVVPNYKISEEIIDYLSQPDDVSPNFFRYETHLPPIFFPNSVVLPPDEKFPENDGVQTPFNLEIFPKITKVEQHKNTVYESIMKTFTEKPCYLVVRRDLLFSNQSGDDQKRSMKKLIETSSADYKPLPSILKIATVALIHHVVHKKCFFHNGHRNPKVSSCERLLINQNLTPKKMYINIARVGCWCAIAPKDKIWGGLSLDMFSMTSQNFGVMAIKQFPVLQKTEEEKRTPGKWTKVELDDVDDSR